MESIRSTAQRQADTRHRLEHDVDAWVASSDQHGGPPYLVPLSFLWDGRSLLFATAETSVTGRNMETTGRVRIALGHTRDVILIDGMAESLALDALPAATAEQFAVKTGFDPRESPGHRWFRVQPERIRAWREAAEDAGRTIMRDGTWL